MLVFSAVQWVHHFYDQSLSYYGPVIVTSNFVSSSRVADILFIKQDFDPQCNWATVSWGIIMLGWASMDINRQFTGAPVPLYSIHSNLSGVTCCTSPTPTCLAGDITFSVCSSMCSSLSRLYCQNKVDCCSTALGCGTELHMFTQESSM